MMFGRTTVGSGCLVGFAMALAPAVVPFATADVIQDWEGPVYHYRINGLPDFDQRRHAVSPIPGLPFDGRSYCAPTTSANMLCYISSHTIGGLIGFPEESWLDYDAAEYTQANQSIINCATPMETGVHVGGTLISDLNNALEAYLPADRFTSVLMGAPIEGILGLTVEMISYALCSPLFERPVASCAVFYLRWNELYPGTVYVSGGHNLAIASVQLDTEGWLDFISFHDPDDSRRISPGESETSQFPFVRASYFFDNRTFPLTGWPPVIGANVTGLGRTGSFSLVSVLQIAFPTTVYTIDTSGLVMRSSRPTRMEADSDEATRTLAAPLAAPVTDLVFDFTVQRVFAIEGMGSTAKVRSTDGRGLTAESVQTTVTPRVLASGRLGELMVFGLNGSVPTMETRFTRDDPQPVLRTLPVVPDAAAYDDVRDVTYAWSGPSRSLVAIPRDAASQMIVYTVPTSIILTGTVDIAPEPKTGAVWMCASGTAGKMFRLELGPTGTIDSIATATSPAIISPRSPISLSPTMMAFASGSSLRVLKKDVGTGAWSAATDSPLWGVEVGQHVDISRNRDSFDHNSPFWEVPLEDTPDTDVVVATECAPDLNLDGFVDGIDLSVFFANWGQDGFGDFDQNDIVDGADLSMILGQWGPCQ